MTSRINDVLTVLGTGFASLSSAGYIPSEYGNLAAAGGVVAIVALLEKEWRKNKAVIIEEIEDFVEEKTGLDVELDDIVEEIVDTAIETAKDFAEDGDLDVSLSDRAEELKDTLKGLTVKELKEQLEAKGLPISGKKAELIARLLEAGDE